MARAKALVRRAQAEPDQPRLVRAGKLEIDLERHEVRYGEARVQLRPKEFDLLALLARHPGRVFQRSELLDLVWGYDFPGYTRTVDVHVQQLREKLANGGVVDPTVQTVWGSATSWSWTPPEPPIPPAAGSHRDRGREPAAQRHPDLGPGPPT